MIAIIPIKEHSSRIPNKNFKLFNNKPLYLYILDTLLQVSEINTIIINTDSIKLKYLEQKHKNIIVYPRPENLKGDDISTNILIEDTINSLNIYNKFILQTHVTNPLLTKETIFNSIKTFCMCYENKENDSLFTVNKHYTRLYDSNNNALNHDVNNLIPTQCLDPVYEENSCMYLFYSEDFKKTRNRIGKHPYLYPISKMESCDIDWPEDFIIAELIHKNFFNNKIIFVTGCFGGIGGSICRYFKEKNWIVIGTDIIEESHKYCDIFLKGDISNTEFLKNISEYLIKNYKKIDCLVNNAAYQFCASLTQTTPQKWEKVMNINLKAPYILSCSLAPLLQNGSIVNISSVHSLQTSPGIGAYSVSKAGLSGLTRTLSLELAPSIRVNSICPGAIDTSMLREHVDVNKIKNKSPLRIIGKPEEVAKWVENLIESEFMTGQNIVLDGGASIFLSTEN